MVLYLAATVIGVVAIVFLVIHLTKTGSTTPASHSSTPGATSHRRGGPGAALHDHRRRPRRLVPAE